LNICWDIDRNLEGFVDVSDAPNKLEDLKSPRFREELNKYEKVETVLNKI